MLRPSRDTYVSESNTEILKATIPDATSTRNSIYASSTENISRLLEGWMGSSSSNANNNNINISTATEEENQAPADHKENESFLSYENLSSIANWNNLTSESDNAAKQTVQDERPCLSFLEKWLLDEAPVHADELMEASAGFCCNVHLTVILQAKEHDAKTMADVNAVNGLLLP